MHICPDLVVIVPGKDVCKFSSCARLWMEAIIEMQVKICSSLWTQDIHTGKSIPKCYQNRQSHNYLRGKIMRVLIWDSPVCIPRFSPSQNSQLNQADSNWKV